MRKTKLGVAEVVGRYAKENPASGRVMEKPGFQYEKEIPFPCNDGSVICPGIQCRLHCRREEYEKESHKKI